MNLEVLLTHLLREDTHDEGPEERADTRKSSWGSRQATRSSEKVGSDAGVTTQSLEMPGEDNGSVEHDDPLPHTDLDDQPDPRPHGSYTRGSTQILSPLFHFPSGKEEIQAYVPHYRILPVLSGATIPFCILLDIPGLLTADWYIRTDGSAIIASKPNPLLLDVGIATSTLCMVLANVCLVVRFLERYIKMVTILCILCLSIHDMINIVALATFGSMKDGYTYGQAFWLTFCSTIISMLTNATLVIDLIRTSDFKRSGSGLTRRQRSLVIIIIGLFCYIALGALVSSLLLDLTFIDGLYFTIVTIETIGFGDIVPNSTSSRIFIYFYAILGMVNLAFVVGYIRETVLESLDFGYRRRLLEIQERRRTSRHRRRAEKRWRHAIVWRLRERHAPVWVPKTKDRKSVWSIFASYLWLAEGVIWSTARRSTHLHHGQHGMQLNLWALSPCELEDAALESGCTLGTFLPIDFYDTYDRDAYHHTTGVKRHALPPWFVVHPNGHVADPPTHPSRQLSVMAAIVTRLSLAIYDSGGKPMPNGHDAEDASVAGLPQVAQESFLGLQTKDTGDYRADVEDTEKKAYYTRSVLSCLWLLIFWMGGAAIFKATEGWTYGSAIYFCFVSFTTIGYGDSMPTTPAGRSIFVIWALIGVAIMTIIVSVVSEAYTIRYKGILGHNSFKRVVRQCRESSRVELSENAQRIDELLPANAVGSDGTIPVVVSTCNVVPQVQYAQRSLEALSRQILAEIRSIQQYMQLVDGFDSPSADVRKSVSEAVWSLIDDITNGRKRTEGNKENVLKDGESRRTLMLLGLARSLKVLMNISEQAVAAAQECERTIEALEQDMEQDEADISI